ncbi:MAG: hypothetical protein ACUVRM_10090 [Bacillota bacterium]
MEEERNLADLVERLQGAVNGFMCEIYRMVLEEKDRPCVWSEKGLDRMARLCALKANGVSLRGPAGRWVS